MKENKKSVIITSVFLAIIIAFTSVTVVSKKSDFSVKENRALMTMPDISLSSIADGSFQQDYDEYLSDQFVVRELWVKGKTKLMLSLGRKDLNGVFFGKDDYLIEKYSESDFDSELYELNEESNADFLNRTAKKGINCTMVLIPSKSAVLTNEMPRWASSFDTSFIAEDMKDLCDDSVRIIDLTDALKAHNSEYIYYKTDHHWTTLGAYYGYKAVNPKTADISSYKSNEVTNSFLGSTYDKVQIKTSPDSIKMYNPLVSVKINTYGESDITDSLFDYDMLNEKSKYDFFMGGNYARADITASSKSGKTLLLLKDSFSNSVLPFMVSDYSKIIMLDLRYFTDDVDKLIDGNKDITDVIVMYNTEKFIKDENQSVLDGDNS